MAGQADGSIIVDTELNSEGFKAGSAELLAAIKSLSNEVKTLGQVLKDTFSSNQGVTATDGKVQALEATITSLRAEVQSLKTQLTELQEKFDNLGGAKTAETPIDGIAESAQKADSEVAELKARIKELEGTISGLQAQFAEALEDPMDVRFDTSAAEAQISSLESRIEELEAKLQQAQMSAAGNATPTGANVNLDTTTGSGSSLERQIASVNSGVERLELNFQRAMSGSESSITAFNARASALESKIASIRQRLDELGRAKIPTSDYAQLSAEVEKAGKKLEFLLNRQEKMQASGVRENTKAWATMQYELDQAAKKYDALEAAKRRMEASGQAVYTGADTTEYQRLVSLLNQASARLNEMQTALGATGGPVAKLTSGARGVFQWIAKAASTLGGKFMSGVGMAVSGVKKLASSARGLGKPLRSLTSSVLRLGPALLMARGVMGILRRAVSAFMAENQQLSSTLNACWSGIGNLLGPVISRVINLVATAVAYLTKFLSLLGFVGSSTKKAISSAGGAAKKETDKLNSQLASFDELNVLQQDDTSGGGGGGADEAELPEVTLPDWVAQMIEQLKSGNWAEAATILTDELNRMVDSVDWAGLGDKLASGLDGVLTFLATAITTFDWNGLGKSLGEFVNSVIHGANWANLGTVLGWKFIALLKGLGGLVAKLDWAAFGTAISDAFMGLWNSIDWAGVGRLISDGIVGLLTSLSAIIGALDWQALGNAIATCVSAIDWSGVASAIFTAIGNALGGLARFLFGLVKSAFGSLLSMGQETSEKYGTDIAGGILLGILEGLYNLGGWIVDNIFTPFIEGFKSAFGINSPSTVMKEQGDFIIAGLLEGLEVAKKTWTDIGKNICTGIIEGIREGWERLKKKVQELATNLLEAVKIILGIHSPSRLFRDEVGMNIGYGIGEGIEASEGSVLASVRKVADAISREFNANKYTLGGVVSNTEVNDALMSFSDKIADSFTSLMDRLQAIANGTSFTVPRIAQGMVVPYKAQADYTVSRGSTDSTGNEKLVADISEAVYTAVLTAMRQSESNNVPALNVYLDGRQITATVEKRQRERGAQIVTNGAYAY